jgi:hypothetical protein
MGFDELYDNMLHHEFRTPSDDQAVEAESGGSWTNPSRSRTAALVASGGLACAVVGALLGGLGSEFGVSPAAAHSLKSSSDFVPLTTLANAAFSVPRVAAPALPKAQAASFSHTQGNGVTTLPTNLGGVVKGITALEPATPVLDSSTAPAGITAAPAINQAGATTAAAPKTASGILTSGLDGVLSDLTASLSGLTVLPSDPAAGLTDTVGPLVGVLSDLSSTLTNLISILPAPTTVTTPSLPVVVAAAPAAPTDAPAVSAPVRATSALPKPVAAVVTPLLNAVATAPSSSDAATDPTAGTGLPSLPTVPLPVLGGTPLPSLPVLAPTTAAPTLPTIDLPVLPAAAGSTPTCVTTPALPLPLPTGVSGGLSLGSISVGVSVGDSTSATVCAS